jgi:putative hydrolase of the HAD superfamily
MDLASESARHTLRHFLEFVGGDLSLLAAGEKAVYGELSPDLRVAPLEGAAEVLENLRKRHKLALVSIGNPHKQLLKMKSAGLDSTIFSKIVISETEDKTPAYREVLEALNVAPSQTVVCGDRVKRDLLPAKELGCRTIQMRWGRGLCLTSDSAGVDFIIDRPAQIQEIIEKL